MNDVQPEKKTWIKIAQDLQTALEKWDDVSSTVAQTGAKAHDEMTKEEIQRLLKELQLKLKTLE